jgi:hypothetical protein
MRGTTIKDYYTLTASILSPFEGEIAPFHQQANWEHFVSYSSAQFVLPTVYCQIIKKGWSAYFPEDLLFYLEALTEENRHRNRALLTEVRAIASLLNEAGIEHTFLKGCAMLAGGYYEDIGERMIGDIDLLTYRKDSTTAYACLQEAGYDQLPWEGLDPNIVRRYIRLRHLQRLIHPDKIGAVEVHTHLISGPKAKNLEPEFVLDRKVETQPGLFIPAESDLHLHTLYNWQINDRGGRNLTISFRAAYDSLLQLKQHPELIKLQDNNPVVRNFYTLLTPFFQALPPQKSLRQSIFLFKLNHPTLERIWRFFSSGINKFFKSLVFRTLLFTNYPDYRKKVVRILLHGRKQKPPSF